MSIVSRTEFVDGAAVITDVATCDGCGTKLEAKWAPPESTINKALATAGWYRGGILHGPWCPDCGVKLPGMEAS